MASIGVHLPVYEVLGDLADTLLADTPSAEPPAGPVEFELEPLAGEEAPEAPEEVSEETLEEAEQEVPDRAPQPEPERPKPPAQQRVDPVPVPKAPSEPVKIPRAESRLAVEQKSDDPDVKTPENAQFIAEENRRVQEETVASITNLQRDERPQSGAPPQPESQEEGAGDDETVVDALEERSGEERPPEPQSQPSGAPESRQAQDAQGAQDAQDAPQNPPPDLQEPPTGPAETQPARTAPPGPAQSAEAAPADPTPSQPAPTPTPEPEDEVIVLDDGEGTLVIRRPRPVPTAPTNNGLPAGAQGPSGGGGPTVPNLRLNFRQFEAALGADNLRRQREAYAAAQRSKAKGGGRQRRWRKFRAAIENYVAHVKPGEQTALNAAASPFAVYLATIHRRIHAEFALGFLRNLPLSGGPFNDASLYTKLEIVINRDGTVHQVGVVTTSGLLPFDFGAFDAVMRAGPFTAPPSNILSGDGRVYMHWGFYRDARQCGTFNASPFILRAPGESSPQPPSQPGSGPRRDRGMPPANSDDSEMGQVPRRLGRQYG